METENARRIPWSRPDIGLGEKEAVQRVMDSGWLSQGRETDQFEYELETYIGCKHVVCVNSGTSALMAALLAIAPKRVAVPSYTFPATWNAAIICGLTPRFAEIDEKTFTMKPPPKEPLDDETPVELLMPVSVAGLPLNPEEWEGRPVLEDACEALGSESRHGKTGSLWTTCFSFHIAKLLTTVEGGCVATNEDQLDYDMRLIRSHGENPETKYVFERLGLNLRTTDLASAIGRVQLKKLPQYLSNRAKTMQLYRQELRDLVGFQEYPTHAKVHGNMMAPILVEKPDELAVQLALKGIETRRPWPPFSEFEDAYAVYNRVLALPIFNTMTDDETMLVVDAVKEAMR